MSKAKRYKIVDIHNDEESWSELKESNNGEFIKYKDYKELEQQLTEQSHLKSNYYIEVKNNKDLEHQKTELMELVIYLKYNAGLDEYSCIYIDNVLNIVNGEIK